MQTRFIGLILVAVQFFIVAKATAISHYQPAQERPYRAQFFKFDPQLDAQKPLAALDLSGWGIAQGLAIGPFSDQWVGAYNLRDHGIAWWVAAPAVLAAPVTEIGQFVMLGFRDGTVTKVEAATGKKMWEIHLDSFVSRSFVLQGSTLLAMTAGQQLYALDFQSGATQWIYDAGFPDGLTAQTLAPPVVVGDRVLIGLVSGDIEAVNFLTGKLYWRYNPEYVEARFHDVTGEMNVQGNRLILSRYDGLVAAVEMDERDRRTIWKDTLPAVTNSVLRGGRFYVGCINGDIYAYDINTGRRLWRAVTGQAVTSISAGETMLYIAGTAGRINALDISTGKVAWHDDVGSLISGRPLVWQGQLFFATGMRNIYAYIIN